mgnify:FL=1
MPTQGLNPLVLSKFVLWLAVVAVATVLLMRHKLTARLRLFFVIGGVLLFGVGFGLLLYPGLNPNPPSSLRTLLTSIFVRGNGVPAVAAMLVVLLLVSWISNKSICGYGCQLGLLQDLLHRVPLPKWQPPFWLSNGVRILAFGGLIGGLTLASLDWIGVVDPFRLFQFELTVPMAVTGGLVILASLFVYRPWCRFLCPFGLVSWGVEQVSVYRPRIDRDACKGCQRCVKACPSGAMADFYADATLHADCFACGACIDACSVDDALGWRRKD